MKFRTLLSSILTVATTSLSPLALANPLTIYNFTDFYSTTIANNGPCSNILSDGITPPHTPADKPAIVSEKSIKAACILNRENCDARVYLTNNCTGPAIARVIFSVNTGIKYIVNEPGSNYCITGSGFTVTLDVKNASNCQ